MSALKLVISLWLMVISIFLSASPTLAVEVKKIEPADWNADKQSAFTINTLPFAGICLLAQVQGCPVTVLSDDGKTTTNKLITKGIGGGAVLALTNLTTTFYQVPPTSSVQYLASFGEQFGLGKPVYAQSVGGSGEGIIRPVLNLWQVSRNISYLAFILIFMVVGLMIMFRQKLNPQTVISAQAALPGLIVSLALVTFSYFIAALMVDTAFVGMKLMGYLFSDSVSGLGNQFGPPSDLANDSNLFKLFGGAAGSVIPSMGDLLKGTFLSSPGAGLFSFGILGVLGGIIAGIIGPIGWIAGFGAPIILTALVGLILLIALIVQLFRLFFALLNSYIQILIFTIAGPFMIAFGAIPGRGGIVSFWIRGLLANALVFPAVFATFLFGGAILANTNAQAWQVSPPLFGGFTPEILRVILAYGIVLGTPSIPGIIREVFKVKGPQAFAQAAMGGAMAGVAVGRAGYGAGSTRFRQQAESYYKQESASTGTGGVVTAPAPTAYKWWYPLFGRGRS